MRPRIVALCRSPIATRLLRECPAADVELFRTPDAMLDAALHSAADTVFVEPDHVGGAQSLVLSRLGRHTSIPVLLYGELTSPFVKDAIQALRAFSPTLLLAGFDDDHVNLGSFLRTHSAAGYCQRLETFLATPLARLECRLAEMVRQAIHADPTRTSLGVLCARAGVSVSTFERHTSDAGFVSARAIMLCGRATDAFHWLNDPAFSKRDVASKTGYHSARTLREMLARWIGISSLDEMRTVPADEFLARIAEAVCQEPQSRHAAEVGITDE